MNFIKILSFICFVTIIEIFPQEVKSPNNLLDSSSIIYYENDLPEAYYKLALVIKSDSNNVEALNYYAEVCRRLEYFNESDLITKMVLEKSSCNSFALTTLGDLYLPQYSNWEKANYDTSWKYYLQAIRCNEAEGQAWLSIWNVSIYRDDLEMERKALEHIYQLKFFTDPVLSYNRWMLKSLPQNAILITNGDMDTYPALALQISENLRPDIVVVNYSMLNMYSYADFISKRNNIVLPFTLEESKSIKPRYSDDSTHINYIAYDILEYWKDLSKNKELGRPLSFASTLSTWIIPSENKLKLLGPTYLYEPSLTDNGWDEGILDSAMFYILGDNFKGKIVSGLDRSPIRRNSSNDFIKELIISPYTFYAVELYRQGNKIKAQKVIDWALNFAENSEAEYELMDTILRIKKLLNL